MFLILTASNGDTYRLNARFVEQYEGRDFRLTDGTMHSGTVLSMRAVACDAEGRTVPGGIYLAREPLHEIDAVLGACKPIKQSDYEAAAAAGYLPYGDEY